MSNVNIFENQTLVRYQRSDVMAANDATLVPNQGQIGRDCGDPVIASAGSPVEHKAAAAYPHHDESTLPELWGKAMSHSGGLRRGRDFRVDVAFGPRCRPGFAASAILGERSRGR